MSFDATSSVLSSAYSAFDLERENARLERASPKERLAFAVDAFGDGLLFTSSFGAQSGVLLHLWSQVARHLPVVFIDTGFLFPETLRYRDSLAALYGLEVKVVRPAVAPDELRAIHGEDLPRRDPDLCCELNKVSPLAPLRDAARAWVSGLRRDQGASRRDVAILEPDVDGLVRVHPLATFTKQDVAAYLARHEIPEHPLARRHYLSIGCAPCTEPVADGEDERAGRWAWTGKTECGLHSRQVAGAPRRRAVGA